MTLETKVEAKKTSVNEDDSSLSVVEFLREVEEPLKEVHLPLGKGKFIYTSLLGTAAHLSTSQNIKATFLILLLDPDPDLDPQPSDLKLLGGNLHGTREHPNREGEILPRHLHHKCKQANINFKY